MARWLRNKGSFNALEAAAGPLAPMCAGLELGTSQHGVMKIRRLRGGTRKSRFAWCKKTHARALMMWSRR
jgi:hypothetical protein